MSVHAASLGRERHRSYSARRSQSRASAVRWPARRIESTNELMTTEESGKPPMRDGVAASTLHLPAGPWRTVFACLIAHFDGISEAAWVGRFQRGCVLDSRG